MWKLEYEEAKPFGYIKGPESKVEKTSSAWPHTEGRGPSWPCVLHPATQP